MKALLLLLLLAGLFGSGIQTISRTNRFSREAATAYEQQDYPYAIAAYEYLLNELEVQDDQIRLNLAHSYYRAHYLDQAKTQYQLLVNHQSTRIRALAMLQLGNVATLQKKYTRALILYRSALIADPGNESARYNYELLKKYLQKHPELIQEEEEPEPLPAADQGPDDALPPPAAEEQEDSVPGKKPDTQGTEQEETDSREQTADGTPENTGGSGNGQGGQQDDNAATGPETEEAAGQEKGDTLGQNTDTGSDLNQGQAGSSGNISDQDLRAQTQRARLQQMNLTPEKAQMLLNAMRQAELQYIQQLPKKATKKQDRSKPDW